MPSIDYKLISLLTASQAHAFRVVPVALEGPTLTVQGTEKAATLKPKLRLVLGKQIDLQVVPEKEVERLLATYYPFEQKATGEGPKHADADAVKWIDQVIQEAVEMGSSDIHLERYEEEARVRFRWEGQLVEKYEIPLDQYNALISRIKILAALDISERRLPQDGRIHFSTQSTKIDLRVSTIPGKYGEKAVLRLLSRDASRLNLAAVGFQPKELVHYQTAIQHPNGIILITGPTGSGKTTTLYATLHTLNEPSTNILTVEDPIEYTLSGINQVQVKEAIGLTFDAALRAFLRQDPDVIMVGEIRDLPTAQIAIRAALTGHLVFSTLHTNSAWDAIARLTDMGIEPYLIASALRLVVAQRLVRLLCPHCKKEEMTPVTFREEKVTGHFTPVGCPKCFYTGYKGRKAVFELLPITPTLKTFIKNAQTLDADSPPMEMPSLIDNLKRMVEEGQTSFEEAKSHL